MVLNVLVVLSICFLCCRGVQAITKQSDRRVLNEPHDLISVLPSTEDDDFDCVDIYKQPALSHPLLKNHKIQLSPRFSKKQVKSLESSRVGSPIEANEQSRGCPLGKVPIQRSKSDHQFTKDFPGQHFATIDTTEDTMFHGARALISINRPSVFPDQYSKAQIWVQSLGSSVIQAGWAVHPQLYGDHDTHLTIRWTSDGFKGANGSGCYNAQCPGFVQVDPTYRPGQGFQNISVAGGPQFVVDVSIIQEQSTLKWWLTVQNIRIGYWPSELFNFLGEGAALIRYGGTTSASRAGISPQMGTGSFPNRDYKTGVGFFSQNKIMDSNFIMSDIDLTDMVKNMDASPNCYGIDYYGYVSSDLRATFSYGGPGGGSCGT